jgi:hypothetical protein
MQKLTGKLSNRVAFSATSKSGVLYNTVNFADLSQIVKLFNLLCKLWVLSSQHKIRIKSIFYPFVCFLSGFNISCQFSNDFPIEWSYQVFVMMCI